VVAGTSLLAGCGTTAPVVTRQAQYSSPKQIRYQRAHPAPLAPGSDAIVSGALQAPGGPYLLDRFGRVVTLHGVNAVYKRPPFELSPAPGKPWNFSAADAREIAGLGFNVVRLGILWEGIEPGIGGPNQAGVCTPGKPGNPRMFRTARAAAYLAQVTRTVDLLGRYHVYTLLDMHQDVYSQAFRGEGAPAWAVCTDGQPIVPYPGRWSSNYANPALLTAESHFWTNDVIGDLQGQFDRAWAVVARHFAGNPWIVGYDPYNEPYSTQQSPVGALDFAVDLECFYTGRAHPGVLNGVRKPVTCPADDPREGVVPVIEAADRHHLVFVEPDNYSLRHRLPSLLGPMNFPRLVYNFHAYCRARNPVTGDPVEYRACADEFLANVADRVQERSAMSSARQRGGPAWILSEFGATQSVPLVDGATTLANVLRLGWIYWSWKYYDDPTGSTHEALAAPTGALEPTADVLDRPYAEAIAGTPITLSYEDSTGTLRVAYAPARRVTAPTVVVVPAEWRYPHGYCAKVKGGAITSRPGAVHLLITAAPGFRRVTVTLRGGGCSPPATAGLASAR
jgi:endoglycosylceramidase